MRKTFGVLLTILIGILAMSNIQTVHAVSTGYERYKDNRAEVYFEYFPIVPFNPQYPTASEEFPIKFYIWQHDYSQFIAWYTPIAYKIDVYYFDECGFANYVTWKRWYPTSTSQNGITVSWSLSYAQGALTLEATLHTSSIKTFSANYDKYYESFDGRNYLHLASIYVEYFFSYSSVVTVEGAGSIGIPNDLAPNHQGHHTLIWIRTKLWWNLANGLVPIWDTGREVNLILGDDNPSDTDCWLTVEQGDIVYPSGGGPGKVYLMDKETEG